MFAIPAKDATVIAIFNKYHPQPGLEITNRKT
jgi:hypothetical protein